MNRGFTLLEMLLAMAIFSVTSIVFLGIAHQHLNTIDYMQKKTIAGWIAKNKLVEIQVNSPWPGEGSKDELQEMGGFKWWTKTTVTKGPLPNSRQIKVSVGIEAEELFDKSNEMLSLNSLLTQPQPSASTGSSRASPK